MRLLLDTHLLLWALDLPERLGEKTLSIVVDVGNEVLFSTASIWEIAIKAARRRPDFAFDPELLFQEAVKIGFVELPIRLNAVVQVAKLPPHHRDPFDRLLIAQAMSEPVRFFTADHLLSAYSELVTLI